MNKVAAKKLIEAREKRGYTQTQMADLLAESLSQTYSLRQYQKLEEGKFPKYKKEIVEKLDKILGSSLYELIYDQNVPRATLQTAAQKSIRKPKIELNGEQDGILFVPISAQAGYSARILDPIFKSGLERLYIPGFPYRGERFRVWEVEGNSMEDAFREHTYVLTEVVENDQWENIRDNLAYVIVTIDDILLKWVKKKTKNEWVMSSENKELYPPFPIPIRLIKEVWVVKKKMEWINVPPKLEDAGR